MIHEGFWDLYCKKPGSHELNAKKLEGWMNRINLVQQHTSGGPPSAPVDEDGEEEEEKGFKFKDSDKKREYAIEDIVEAVKADTRADQNTRDGVENMFFNTISWGVFDKDSTPIKELAAPGQVTVIDVNGKQLIQQRFSQVHKADIKTASLPKGSYIIQIKTATKTPIKINSRNNLFNSSLFILCFIGSSFSCIFSEYVSSLISFLLIIKSLLHCIILYL